MTRSVALSFPNRLSSLLPRRFSWTLSVLRWPAAKSVDARPTTLTFVLWRTLKVARSEHPLPPEQASGTSTTPPLTRVLPTLATLTCDADLPVVPAGAIGAGGDAGTGGPGNVGGGVGHGPPPAPSLTSKVDSDSTQRPLHATASAYVAKLPHAFGNVIHACGPPESSRCRFESGSCGRSPDSTVSWPVSESSNTSHGSLTISPGPSATR